MTLISPQKGEIIRYNYLWARENTEEDREGLKGRPCLVVNVQDKAAGKPVITVIPITHSPSSEPNAVELPTTVKRRLGLSDSRSWLMLNEYNVFTWPNDEVQKIEGKMPSTYSYGLISQGAFKSIRQRMANNIQAGRIQAVRRVNEFVDNPAYRRGRVPAP